jgi:alpha-L-fucosidase
LNNGWAYAPRIHNIKSAETIIGSMRKAHSRDAVFMLNVGPRPFGDIHPEEQQVLRQIGWTIRNHGLLD